MNRESLGELEELVLLVVGGLNEKGYALNILDEIAAHTNRKLDVTAIHSVLRRLERKGLVKSVMGGATKERGGRRKRFFQMTTAGRKVVEETMEVRMVLYNKLPKLTFSAV